MDLRVNPVWQGVTCDSVCPLRLSQPAWVVTGWLRCGRVVVCGYGAGRWKQGSAPSDQFVMALDPCRTTFLLASALTESGEPDGQPRLVRRRRMDATTRRRAIGSPGTLDGEKACRQ